MRQNPNPEALTVDHPHHERTGVTSPPPLARVPTIRQGRWGWSVGSAVRTVRRYAATAQNVLLRRWPRRIGRARRRELYDLLATYDHETAFVHAGLSDVNAAFDGDPYELVRDALLDQFDGLVAPGFTDYFRTSGVFDRARSRPKHGTFNALLLDDAEYRTQDPIKSMLAVGSHPFDDDCDRRDTYSPTGYFGQLYGEDLLLVNIGTPYFTCSYMHYLEARNADYMRPETFEGYIHDCGGTFEVTQTCHYREGQWSFDRFRLHRRLRLAGVLDQHDLGGVRIFVAPLDGVHEVLTSELERDPYYLVT